MPGSAHKGAHPGGGDAWLGPSLPSWSPLEPTWNIHFPRPSCFVPLNPWHLMGTMHCWPFVIHRVIV